jgi:hypothetical protein
MQNTRYCGRLQFWQHQGLHWPPAAGQAALLSLAVLSWVIFIM